MQNMNSGKPKSFFLRIVKYISGSVLLFLLGFIIYFFSVAGFEPPPVQDYSVLDIEVLEPDPGLFTAGKARFRESESGLWELYTEGLPFERGVSAGKLTQKLIRKQEEAFTDEIKRMIPSKNYLKFLKYLIAWFNRNIQDHIPKEYLYEIYGVSLSASPEFNYIGNNYERLLNYHAAHDIGHALNDFSVAGCTSFSVRGSQTEDGSMLLGRNFDFYVGDRFAEDKIVMFVKPERGHRFALIVWGGFTGAVSGMNDRGLTLTMNAAKSDLPYKAATPISLIAREILQYAENIEEALAIAKKRKAFVSEAFMIGSNNDRRTAIIEITPKSVALYDPADQRMVGSNHFQSEAFRNSETNLENIRESSSMYRYKRMHQLLDKYPEMNPRLAASVLRNRNGLDDKLIGMGNEKAINQLIAHHSVIFKPDELKFWVSSNPYQLGKYVCYDLDSVFRNFSAMKKNREIYEREYSIPSDSFLSNGGYQRFLKYKQLKSEIKQAVNAPENKAFKPQLPKKIIQSNPHFFYACELAGDYARLYDRCDRARKYYRRALSKEISSLPERQRISEKLRRLSEK